MIAKRLIKNISLVGCLAAGLFTATPTLVAAAPDHNSLRIETTQGPVEGFAKGAAAEFLGIPYAAPPVGDLRWMPPKKHAQWTNVLETKTFGPTCAQNNTAGVFAGPVNNNEDCLYLNVFAPLDRGARGMRPEKLPVIFWIHGGGNFAGESTDYDGSKLAVQGHTVVVTINYRLGSFGWFAHPALDAEGHPFANYGMLDQQLALRWVRENIAKFGGDEDNITVGGQSAGAWDTEGNVVSPLAAGLFHRAIFQSIIWEPTPLPFAESLGGNFGALFGCGADASAATAKCLRSLTAAQIESIPVFSGYNQSQIADGQILPSAGFWDAFSKGRFNHMPIMSGTTHDEYAFFIAPTEYYSGPPQAPFTAADVTDYITSQYSGNAGAGGSPPAYPAGTVDKVLAKYPLIAYSTAQLQYVAVGTDGKYGACPQRRINRLLATQVPVYAYEFDDKTAPFYFPPMLGFVSGAYHTGDIQYLFPLYHGATGIIHPLNSQQEKLSDELVAAWSNFARTGNPNGHGNSPWPRYEVQQGKESYILSENIPALSTKTDAAFAADHKCDFWDKINIP
jgi:para-nitrobenzyl esterase